MKGFASIEGCSLIEVTGTGMAGVPGTASKIFGVVQKADVNVVMISQSSSEHSICFAVKQSDAEKAVDALNNTFAEAIRDGLIAKIVKIDNVTVLAAVGEAMASSKG